MFEIFLFINPTGLYCYNIESKVQKAINDLDIDVTYHFIPLANVGVAQDDIHRRRQVAQKLCQFSFYTLTTTRALEDYHAIKIAYGNKRARKFLLTLQKRLTPGINDCPISLPDKVVSQLGFNLGQIKSLRESNYVKESIDQDQKLADQWKVRKTPTTIIFNEDENSESGVLLEGVVTEEALRNIFAPMPKVKPKRSFKNIFSANHLRLI